MKISRHAYAEMFGPTTGDKGRLADSELFIEIERDYRVDGEEGRFGGGKDIRGGVGPSERAARESDHAVIAGPVLVRHSGILKAVIGIKNGTISAIGKA